MTDRAPREIDFKRFPVLYVDDEPENLRIFELGFRRQFEVLTAESGEAGLQMLEEHPVAVVLSDHRMPGMSGTEFLSRVRETDPRTVRMLVTAYGDAETLGAAINDGSIYRYVPKPWQPDDLNVAIRRAIELYALDREREQLIRELSTINQLATTIQQELSLDRLLDLLLASLTRMLGFDGASLLLFDEAGERLAFVKNHPAKGAVAEFLREHPIGTGAAPAFLGDMLNGRPAVLRFSEAERLEPPVRAWLHEVAAEEILVAPLPGKRGVQGAIAVDNRRGGRDFEPADEALLSGIAVVAAAAVENARVVDELKRSRQQVMRSERLGTLGTLAAGLAHEINNPLVSIHTFLSLANEKRNEDDPEFWGEYHRLACGEVERIRGLVATMSRLGRSTGEAPRPAMCELGTIAQEVATLVAREARARSIEISLEADPETPKATVIREQIHQVILNLALNAIHASEDGQAVQIAVGPGGPGGADGVTLEVIDHGHGIAEDDLERIFDPFFTTKGPDGGTGLGLMICHRVVADHGGGLEVSATPGGGATFRVRLPLEPAPTPEV